MFLLTWPNLKNFKTDLWDIKLDRMEPTRKKTVQLVSRKSKERLSKLHKSNKEVNFSSDFTTFPQWEKQNKNMSNPHLFIIHCKEDIQENFFEL